MPPTRRDVATAFMSAAMMLSTAKTACAASRRAIDRAARRAIRSLYAAQPRTVKLAKRAEAMLIFPEIVKAEGSVDQSGSGVLYINGDPRDFYNISAASFGPGAEAQSFSYVLFFMNDAALKAVSGAGEWIVGSRPSVVVLGKSAAPDLSNASLLQDVYAIPFGLHGLMTGIGLEGSKIARINPDA